MNQLLTRSICPKCNGEGEYLHEPSGENEEPTMLPCESCNGIGYFVAGNVNGAEDIAWIKRKIRKILQKLDVPDDD